MVWTVTNDFGVDPFNLDRKDARGVVSIRFKIIVHTVGSHLYYSDLDWKRFGYSAIALKCRENSSK